MIRPTKILNLVDADRSDFGLNRDHLDLYSDDPNLRLLDDHLLVHDHDDDSYRKHTFHRFWSDSDHQSDDHRPEPDLDHSLCVGANAHNDPAPCLFVSVSDHDGLELPRLYVWKTARDDPNPSLVVQGGSLDHPRHAFAWENSLDSLALLIVDCDLSTDHGRLPSSWKDNLFRRHHYRGRVVYDGDYDRLMSPYSPRLYGWDLVQDFDRGF